MRLSIKSFCLYRFISRPAAPWVFPCQVFPAVTAPGLSPPHQESSDDPLPQLDLISPEEGTSAPVAPVAVRTCQKNEDATDAGTVSAQPEAALWLLLPHHRCSGHAGVAGGVIHLQLLVKSSKTCRKSGISRNILWFRTTGM